MICEAGTAISKIASDGAKRTASLNRVEAVGDAFLRRQLGGLSTRTVCDRNDRKTRLGIGRQMRCTNDAAGTKYHDRPRGLRTRRAGRFRRSPITLFVTFHSHLRCFLYSLCLYNRIAK